MLLQFAAVKTADRRRQYGERIGGIAPYGHIARAEREDGAFQRSGGGAKQVFQVLAMVAESPGA